MRCVSCWQDIDWVRVEFIQEFNRPQVCRNCSTEQRAIGFLSYSHKTAPELVMVAANNTEDIRKCDRANRRAR